MTIPTQFQCGWRAWRARGTRLLNPFTDPADHLFILRRLHDITSYVEECNIDPVTLQLCADSNTRTKDDIHLPNIVTQDDMLARVLREILWLGATSLREVQRRLNILDPGIAIVDFEEYIAAHRITPENIHEHKLKLEFRDLGRTRVFTIMVNAQKNRADGFYIADTFKGLWYAELYKKHAEAIFSAELCRRVIGTTH